MRISPEAAQILLKVWTEWAESADYALITIEPEYASRLSEKVKVAQEVKARYGHFHQLTFFEHGPVVFGGELEDLIGSEQVDEVESAERVVLEKPIFIPGEWQARLDCVMLKVTHEEVQWEGYIKHTGVRWETAGIPLSALKKPDDLNCL
jgi:glucose-6-phosphate 1-dehydrogenase